VVTSTEITAAAAAPRKTRPDVLFEKNELQKAVWSGINDLPEKFREIIILNHFQDMSYDQIAGVLDIPRGSVMSRLYYARLKLREILEKRGIEL
jgi:RNA polymerase sigma-70 factor (ECF subfamily)